jgi:hypothetical protein
MVGAGFEAVAYPASVIVARTYSEHISLLAGRKLGQGDLVREGANERCD